MPRAPIYAGSSFPDEVAEPDLLRRTASDLVLEKLKLRHLITGAGSGIGASLTDRLYARGDDLILVARSSVRAGDLRERWPGARTITVDLSDLDAISAAWPMDVDTLDTVVHSAGVVAIGNLADMDADSWRSQIILNLMAPAELTRLALPAVRRAQGTVVFLNSASGLGAGGQWSAYAASKFGLRGLADALREEEAQHGVRVCSLFPGRVATPMQEGLHKQEGQEYVPGRWIQPDTVASSILHAIDTPVDATVSDIQIKKRKLPVSPT